MPSHLRLRLRIRPAAQRQTLKAPEGGRSFTGLEAVTTARRISGARRAPAGLPSRAACCEATSAADCAMYPRRLGTGEGHLVMPWSARHNHLRFAVEHDEGRVTVHLAGELDYGSAATAHLALARAGSSAKEIVLDLSRVVFVDAAGLRFLLSAQRRARAAHRRLIVRRPSRTIRRMLELTGAGPLLAIDTGDRHPPAPAAKELIRILDAAIEPAMRIARADLSTAHLVDATTGAHRIVAQRGFNSAVLDYLEAVSDSESVRPATPGSEQSVWVPDVARSSILADTPALDALLDAGIRAVASIPVKPSDAQPIAILSVQHRLVTDWTPEQKIELEQLARSVAQQCLEALRLHPTPGKRCRGLADFGCASSRALTRHP